MVLLENKFHKRTNFISTLISFHHKNYMYSSRLKIKNFSQHWTNVCVSCFMACCASLDNVPYYCVISNIYHWNKLTKNVLLVIVVNSTFYYHYLCNYCTVINYCNINHQQTSPSKWYYRQAVPRDLHSQFGEAAL